jgi:hypothetical protein
MGGLIYRWVDGWADYNGFLRQPFNSGLARVLRATELVIILRELLKRDFVFFSYRSNYCVYILFGYNEYTY